MNLFIDKTKQVLTSTDNDLMKYYFGELNQISEREAKIIGFTEEDIMESIEKQYVRKNETIQRNI